MDDDAGRKRVPHNFVEMMQRSASNDESNESAEASSDELDGKEAFDRPNRKKAKSADPPGDSPKLPVADKEKRDESNRGNAQGLADRRVSALPARPTASNAGTARDLSRGVHASSLLRKSTLARSGYARDIPPSVVVDSSLRTATGSANSLPTGFTLIHRGSARRVPDGVPSGSLPTAAFHSSFAREMPQAVPITVRSTTDVREVTRIRSQGSVHNYTGGVSNLGDSYGHNVAPSDVMQSIHRTLNGNYLESQIAAHGVEFLDKLLSNKVPILAQGPASAVPKDVHQGPEVTVAAPGCSSKQHINYVNRKSGRIRRAKITERFRSLQEILPNCDQANRDELMDDIIDYVKYLQLQIKSLSQSTLDDETTDHNPFINIEGFGHYLHNQGTLIGEPLEEMIGRLMEANETAFTQLLESRGLYVRPVALAGGTFYKP